MEEAKEMGAIALFGEKYGDKVRVVKFGNSIELCGGTHEKSTGRIGYFKILSESAIAAGVRRIEAVTGEKAENVVYTMQGVLKGIKEMFNNAPDVAQAVKKMIEENSDYRKQIEDFFKEKASQFAKVLQQRGETINGISVVKLDKCEDPNMLREAASHLQKVTEKFALVGAYAIDGKPQLMIMYSNDLVQAGKNAGADIKEAAKFIQGGGGGQPGLATAGGRNVDGLQDALGKLIELATK